MMILRAAGIDFQEQKIRMKSLRLVGSSRAYSKIDFIGDIVDRSEKRDLVRLLGRFMDDLCEQETINSRALTQANCERRKCSEFKPVKALYTHARIVQKKLAAEINDDLTTYWL